MTGRALGRRGDLLGFLVIAMVTALTAAAGGAAGDFTSAWYKALRKPTWQPSGAAIGAVWTVLYVLTATSAGLLWRRRDRRHVPSIAVLFGVQYVLNVAFTPLFTRKRDLTLATVDCALL